MKLTDELFTVLKIENNRIDIKITNRNHDIFKAHFPNKPILPGFLQLDIAEVLIENEFNNLKKVKFIQPIYPNDIISYFFGKKNNIIIKKGNKKVSEIIYA